MLSRIFAQRSLIALSGLIATASPAYAHWGAASPWATSNSTVYCSHSHAGNTYVRRARLQVTLIAVSSDACSIGSEVPGGSVPGIPCGDDDAYVTNVSASGSADIVLAGYDWSVPPGSFLPWLAAFDDVPRNAGRWFSSATGTRFIGLQAQCFVSNSML